MSGFYQQLCNMFVRPVRQTYNDFDLGPIVIGKNGIRENFTFKSSQNCQIKTTFFKNKQPTANICVVYLHSFNGSRLQSIRYAEKIIELGFHFCCFDFAGCGNSSGQYVSLGCKESLDILNLLQNLKGKYKINDYFLWGRSMGAVAAIKFYNILLEQQRNDRLMEYRILGLILDSAFISLRRMVIEVGNIKFNLPEILIKAFLLMIGSSIEERGNFKIQELQLQREIQLIRCSTLLLASKEDKFVNCNHSEQIFSLLKMHENKQIQYIRGEHYENRDQKTLNIIYNFINKNYKKYVEFQSRISNLRYVQNIHEVQQGSIQKYSKSLKKYEPKVSLINKAQSPVNNNVKKILFPQDYTPSSIKNNEFQQKNKSTSNCLSVISAQRITLHYNQEKNIIQSEKKIDIQSNIKFLDSSLNKQTKFKNELTCKSKPNLSVKLCEVFSIKKTEERKSIKEQTAEKQRQMIDNHCNIIHNKLKKKGKINRQKAFEFKLHQIQKQDEHINSIKFQPSNTKTALYFNFNHVLTPKNVSKRDDKETATKNNKKISMTAQQYKNNHIYHGKSVINLSPNVKKRGEKGEKGSCTEIKIKVQSARRQKTMTEQSKSMNNLAPYATEGNKKIPNQQPQINTNSIRSILHNNN